MNPLFWIVAGVTVLSGFFSVMGYSLRALRRSQLDEALNGAGSGRMEVLERQLTPLRLTVSFCRALANIVLVVALVQWFNRLASPPVAAVGGAAVAGGLIAVFGVAIPHAWALYAGNRAVATMLPVLLALRYALYPVVAVMLAFDVPIRRLSGAAEAENGDAAKQEIIQAASEGRAEGAVDEDEVEMIESVIEFGETHAGEIMTPRTDIFALSVDLPWGEAAGRIVEAGHSRVPVYEEDLDHIIGVLYAKDMLAHVGKPEGPPSIRPLLRKPQFVPESKLLDDLLREFKSRKVHMAIVLDEYGGTSGLVTIEDLLEEIVGDISDEYDVAEDVRLHPIDERTAEIDGRMYIDDLNDAMGLEIPEEEDYDTAAGLVFSELGYIPRQGEKLTAHGAEFTVLEADERKILKLLIRRLEPETEVHGQ